MILETHSTRAAKTKSMQNNIHTSIAVRHSAWINRERGMKCKRIFRGEINCHR